MVILFIVSALALFLVINLAVSKRKDTVKIAYAGAYDGSGTVCSVPADRNKTIYTVGEDVVDLSKYDKYVIRGNSLEREGLYSDTYVYTLPVGYGEEQSILGKFVIFRYDNARLAVEHPEITAVDGHKARKAVMFIPTRLSQPEFEAAMRTVLENDPDITDAEACLAKLWTKYNFASGFYVNDDRLIVSVTYKKGEYKDYSFHSLRFLTGVVKYKSA